MTENAITKEEFEALKTELAETKAVNEKLQKIFDERQTKAIQKEKAITKEELLKVLGIEKDPEKNPQDILNEKILGLTTTIDNLKKQISDRDELDKLNAKKAEIAKLAQKYNFIDSNDVLSAIDYTKDDYEAQIKEIAAQKPHWVKKVDTGKSFANGVGTDGKSVEEQIKNAYASGDAQKAIALKLSLLK